MSLIKKCDVKDYLSARRRRGGPLYLQASQPDATGFSGVEPGNADRKATHSVEELPKQSASIGLEAIPIVIASDSGNAVVHAKSQSAQA